jgi:serine/threonine-protein kinase
VARPRRPILEHARFGKYAPITRLATGGMAEVFLARLDGAAGFQKHVALKLVLPELADDEQFVTMFLEEARLAAQVSHPNVVQIFELGQEQSQYFIAMEYLDGVPLTAVMKALAHEPNPADLRMVVGLLAQACEGLHHAHELKRPDGRAVELVHRDVSPPNLFVTVDGVLKVLDFGIAKARDASVRTRSGLVKGKYPYMAPEQLRGESLDRRVDVFALGVLAFELISGRRLFRRETDYLVFKAITEDAIPSLASARPETPPPLCAAVDRALARDRADRFPTARALGEALLASVGGAPSSAALAEWVQRLVAAAVAPPIGASAGGHRGAPRRVRRRRHRHRRAAPVAPARAARGTTATRVGGAVAEGVAASVRERRGEPAIAGAGSDTGATPYPDGRAPAPFDGAGLLQHRLEALRDNLRRRRRAR